MQVKIVPEKIIAASYSVNFYESREYSKYVVQPEPYDDKLSPELVEWLDVNAPNWEVTFDRGDWGEGPADIKISFETESQARNFANTFTLIPCANSRSRGHCANLGKALKKIDRGGDGYGKCTQCGHEFRIMTESNQTEFYDKNGE